MEVGNDCSSINMSGCPIEWQLDVACTAFGTCTISRFEVRYFIQPLRSVRLQRYA
jgi:hypothetical protein